MVKKRRSRRSRTNRNYTQKRNTRVYARPKTKSLRFSPYKPLSVDIGLDNAQSVRRVRTETRTVKKQSGIKKLTVSIGGGHTKNTICKRRHERKEIIHAVGKSGQSGQKRPNNITRNIKC